MKTITYTQMRSDLSATLELLRSGESVTVTQRGKPDTVIIAKLGTDVAERKEVQRPSETVNSYFTKLISSNVSPQMAEGVMNLAKQLDDLLKSDQAQQVMMKVSTAAVSLQGVSESFVKALQHTQTKHAEIIKKLEDK